MKSVIRIIMGASLLVGVVASSGCSDKDQNFWGGVIDSLFGGPSYSYETRCHSYYRRGRYHRECWRERRYYDGRRRYRHPRFEGMPVNPIQGVLEDENSILFLANKYEISYDSAHKLMLALEKAVDSEDMSALADVGLTEEDFAFIAQGKMIFTASIERFAAALDIESSTAQKILVAFTDEVKKQLASE